LQRVPVRSRSWVRRRYISFLPSNT
jgi:hypothetical protein